MSQGVQTIKTASEAITSATSFLEQAKATANQALSEQSSQPIVARVSTEDELLAAIESGKQGLIVVVGDIILTTNQSLNLNDGQSLVGAKYLNEATTYSSISFNFVASPTHGLSVKENALIADLQINYKSDLRENQSSIFIEGDNVTIKDINLSVDIDGSASSSSSGSVCGIFSANNKVNLQGIVNIGDTGIINTADKNNSNRFIGIYKTELTIENNTTLNISTGCYGGYGLGKSTLNLYDNAVLNVYTRGYEGYALGYSNFNLYDNAQINAVTEQNYAHGIISSNINLFSDKNKINLNTKGLYSSAIAGGGGWGYSNIFNAVAGAKIYTKSGLYTSPVTGIKNAVFNIGNALSTIGFQEDTSTKAYSPEDFQKIFDDFSAYMQQTSQATSKTENINKSYETQYISTIEQFDMLIADSSYKGINLLQGQNLQINFNEDRSSNVEVKGVKADSESLGLTTKEWNSQEDIEKSISELESAISSLRSFASAFGNYYSIVTTRQDFTENLINVLEEGADKLTLADMNEESANMLALQTSQQLAINSLSLASQAAQSVLKLF